MCGAFLVASILTAAALPSVNAAATERTVFVTVTDNQGAAVPDLAPADFVIKEGGKEREIVKAVPASTKMRLALAVEERMVGDAAVRTAVFEFMKRIVSNAEIALITVGLRNTTVVDYTQSPDALVGGLNKLTLNPAKESSVAEGILDLSDRISESKPERPVIVVISLSHGQSGVDPRMVLDKLRQSGAIMYAATLAGASRPRPASER